MTHLIKSLAQEDMFRPIRIRRAFAIVGLGCFIAAISAQASVILTMQTVMATAGSTGNSLQITLTNDDPVFSIDVSGFNFLIHSTSPNINFTSALFNTAFPYIFAGNSFDEDNMLPLNTSSGQSLAASDSADNVPTFTTVGPGATFGIADILFDIAPNALNGFDAIVFDTDPANTSVSDQNGMAIQIASFVNGGVITSSVPEPAGQWLMVGGLAFLTLWRQGKNLLRKRFLC